VSALVHVALEEQATLPLRPPTLPDTASLRAQEALQHKPLPRPEAERAAKRANAAAEQVVETAGTARANAGKRGVAGVSATVHAAEQSAAGQVRAAEAKKAHKKPDRP
jgi:hypothetical protein